MRLKAFSPARTSIATGAFLTITMRWSDRLIGLTSTLILARLLVPDDFGVIAMATLVVGLADVLSDLGVNIALIRGQNLTQGHFDTAWTLRLMQAGLATLAVLLLAPQAAEYFGDARVLPVLQWLALSLLLGSFENIGIVALHKEMQFGAEFRFLFIRRVVGFVATIASAWWLGSYWALVIGTLAGRSIGVALSYLVHPMRPKLGLSHFNEIFAVSQWMLLRSIGEFFQNNLHRIIAGRGFSTATMGHYAVASEIAAMPASELLAPINRALFPAMAEKKDDIPALSEMFLIAQQLQTLLVVPAAIGLALVANEAVLVLLGERWLAAAPLLQVLAIAALVQAIGSCSGYVLLVLGRIWHTVLIAWVQVLFFGGLTLLFLPGIEVIALGWFRLASSAVGLAITIAMLLHALPGMTVTSLLASIGRPLAGALAMVVAVSAIPLSLQLSPVSMLVIKVITGAVTYSIVTLGVWQLVGRPAGAEACVISRLAQLLHRRPRDRTTD